MKTLKLLRTAGGAAGILAALALLAGCVAGQPMVVPAEQPATATAPGLANPASVFCADNGGTPDIRSDAAGNQTGYCVFPDGSECDEWAYLRGECAPGVGGQPMPTSEPEVANPAAAYCVQQGGSDQFMTDGSGKRFAVCILPDGTVCPEADFYNGDCGSGKQPESTVAPTGTITSTSGT
ncbi:MAG: DUF333 domain-containing protein [Caldilineales bacterium]